ncbi:hypothetical protein BDZ97DRAFT_1394802 [Flammula alnicola]|nr:hypothetical protein BDZ97DRAFT_1394802 [Flammula alnicola]
MKGKGIAPKNPRDEYALLSYRTARKTAKSLDKAFKDHKQDLKDKTFREALRTTMENAGLQGSSHTHAANQATPKVMPPRRSARIAAKRTK